MGFSPPKGWTAENDILYIHKYGYRITRMTYKGKEGWFLIPVDIKEAVIEFAPDSSGRDAAFEHFEKNGLEKKGKRRLLVPAKSKKKAAAVVKEEGEEKAKDAGEDAEKEDDEDDEEDEKASDETDEKDAGDDT